MIRVSPRIEATVGATQAVPLTADDPDGSSVELAFEGRPRGLEGEGAILRWRPVEAGTWTMTVRATDDDGATVETDVELVSRFPAQPNALLVMGDSIASGHGLDRSDYVGNDSCWRDEDDAYGRLVFNDLVAAGRLDSASATFLTVACMGAKVSLLDTESRQATDVDGRVVAGPERSQLAWAIETNPGVITLTVGVNDFGFLQPQNLVTAEAELRAGPIEAELAIMSAQLREILGDLVAKTDSTVVITTYFNPAHPRSQGVSGCDGECFSRIAAGAVRLLNDAITAAADGLSDRVVLVDIEPVFVGHGAPNGFGVDALRDDLLGLVGDVVDQDLEGSAAYCAKGETQGAPWISAVDCVHPNPDGARAIATTILAALRARF